MNAVGGLKAAVAACKARVIIMGFNCGWSGGIVMKGPCQKCFEATLTQSYMDERADRPEILHLQTSVEEEGDAIE